MRKDIKFKTEDGIELRGWHYLPEKRTGKVPIIVMAHGFSAVKEMYLDRFADAFAAAGLGAWCSTTAISAPATASPDRKSTPGSRLETIETPSRLPKRCPRRTPRSSVFGAQATAVVM